MVMSLSPPLVANANTYRYLFVCLRSNVFSTSMLYFQRLCEGKVGHFESFLYFSKA